ncbi:MAG TPA: SynChlorMet cassette protein ScmC [bacterium]|nr:SynChlorMet cassette protein ScmC [bacterium]
MQVMRLDPGDHGREIHVAVCRTRAGLFDGATDDCAPLCFIPFRLNRELEVVQMEMIAAFVARAALRRESLLLHGALAEYRGSGFIMAGPGGIGKSTASLRLPSPWRTLCDDMTLVVRDDNGQYWAHPWPTWSRLARGETGCSWDVQRAVALRALFFLGRGTTDMLRPVSPVQASALHMESALNLARTPLLPVPDPTFPVSTGIRAAKALALAVPAYSLKLSLTGRFWEEIERVLPAATGDQGPNATDRVMSPIRGHVPHLTPASFSPPSAESDLPSRGVTDGLLRLVYTGVSMKPTLRDPELVEAEPCGTQPLRPGDVVCYESPVTGATVVRRVVSVERQGTGDRGSVNGIRTRADNASHDDLETLTTEGIIGRVTGAGRGVRFRAIHGGRRGLVTLWLARWRERILGSAYLIPHALYHYVAGLGPFDHLLPRRLRPRLVRFDARGRVLLRLVNDRQTVGRYNELMERWYIRRPFRLFVDKRALSDACSLALGSGPGRNP